MELEPIVMPFMNENGYVIGDDRELLKYHAGEVDKKADGLDEGQIPMNFVTDSLDRDSEVLMPKGAQLKNYRKNPVYLWAHNWFEDLPPIGKVSKIKVDSESFRGIVDFDLNDDFAAMIYDKYKNGFLNASSIGFIPIAVDATPVHEGQQGVTFTKYEVLENSGVPVPSNPDALQMNDWKELVDECGKFGCHITEKMVEGKMPEWGRKFYMGDVLERRLKRIPAGNPENPDTALKDLTDLSLVQGCSHENYESSVDTSGLWHKCLDCEAWIHIKTADEIDDADKQILKLNDEQQTKVSAVTAKIDEAVAALTELKEIISDPAGQDSDGKGTHDPDAGIAEMVVDSLKPEEQ